MLMYWLTHGDGQSHGPYTLDELRRFAAEGRVTTTSMVCLVGSSDWSPAGHVIPGLPAGPRPDAPGTGRVISTMPAILLTIVSLLISCFPTGIIALIYVRRANARFAAGDVAGGEQAERVYRRWIIATYVSILIGVYMLWQTYTTCSQLLDAKLI